MANNNPYGMPPSAPMVGNGAINNSQYYYQQQQQSQRISGDGEEVHGLGFFRSSTPTGPNIMQQQQLFSPISPPQTGPQYNYEAFNQNSVQGGQGQYDLFGGSSAAQQGLQQINGAVDDEAFSSVSRSIEGQEEMPMSDVALGGNGVGNYVGIVAGPPPPQSGYLRSEPLGSNEDPRGLVEEEFSSVSRSIEGQEEMPTIDVSLGNYGGIPPGGVSGPPPQSGYQRSETLGADVRNEDARTSEVEDEFSSVSRRIEGEEQMPTSDVAQVMVDNSGNYAGIPAVSGSVAVGPHQRSETLGSDVRNEDGRTGSKGKRSGPKSQNNPQSGSETGDSGGRSGRDATKDRQRPFEDREERRSIRGRKSDTYDRRDKSSRRYESYDEDEDSFGEEDNTERYDRRREKDKPSRPPPRDRDRHRNESLRERDDWDSMSTRESNRYPRHHGGNDEDFRPRSRNSSYQERDDYYYREGRRRRPEDSYSRDRYPIDDYRNDQYRYQRGRDYPEDPSAMYGLRNRLAATGLNPALSAANRNAEMQVYIQKLRFERPGVYRVWYEKYQMYLKNPAKVPYPVLPGFGSAPLSANSSQVQTPVVGSEKPPSGRSSVAELRGISGDDENKFLPIQETREPSPAHRSTPPLFTSAHTFAFLQPTGYLISLRNNKTTLEISRIKPMMRKLPEHKIVRQFPGPLIKDITHKNTIIQFCQKKIRNLEFDDAQVDRDNLILLWELLILLLRQNGSAVGSDIAELLLKSKSGKAVDEVSDNDLCDGEDEMSREEFFNQPDPKNEAADVEKFCEMLLFGHRIEALDFAMENGLWGHALFFASKMGDKTYGNVLVKFANRMPINSPLQTLYQVLCGKLPSAVTGCIHESFGDWKPHLAMILSNHRESESIEGDAIKVLGDSLGHRNQFFAAQFCYLMAEMEFSADSKMGKLLGFLPGAKNTLEATQMTEIYEFARTLGKTEFSLGTSFIKSKLNYAKNLVDLGFAPEAFSYCEELTKSLFKNPIHPAEQSVAASILKVAERLVRCDDTADPTKEPSWISDLRKVTEPTESEIYSRKFSLATSVSDSGIETQNINPAYAYEDQYSSTLAQRNVNPETENISTPYADTNQPVYGDNSSQNNVNLQPAYVAPPAFYEIKNQPSFPLVEPISLVSNGPTSNLYDIGSGASNNNYLYNQPYMPPSNSHADSNIRSHPQMPEANYSKKTEVDQRLAQTQRRVSDDSGRQKEKSLPNQTKSSPNKKPKGWSLSSIFGKMIPKLPNQAILPDDKDPDIVWDDELKRWVNTKEGDDEDAGRKGPPPSDSDLKMNSIGSSLPPTVTPMMMQIPYGDQHQRPIVGLQETSQMNHAIPTNPAQHNSLTTEANQPIKAGPPASGLGVNKYQRPKGLSLRNNYVDVFNSYSQNSNKEEPNLPSAVVPSGSAMPNIFMPNPAVVSADSGPTSFLTPSALSYGASNEESDQPPPPQMFDPASFQNNNMNNYGLNR